jgi:hypothetical protein
MPRATGGVPSRYSQVKLEKPELYDLNGDLGETHDCAAGQPAAVAALTSFANEMRSELGDTLTGTTGSAAREPAHLPK